MISIIAQRRWNEMNNTIINYFEYQTNKSLLLLKLSVDDHLAVKYHMIDNLW